MKNLYKSLVVFNSSRGVFASFGVFRFFSALVALAFLLCAKTAFAQLQFEDVTENAGGFGKGERWGASWGDINGDLLPDIYVNNHNSLPGYLYLNNGDGSFTNVTYALDRNRSTLNKPREDAHGAAFVDFDNDGDQDLLASYSAAGVARLFVNHSGVFNEQASNSNLSNDGNSRMPAWFDYNNDGFLDLFTIANNQTIVNRQDPNIFVGRFNGISQSSLGVSCFGNYGQLVDVNNDGRLDFICGDEGNFPKRIYSTATVPFANITSTIPTVANVIDTAVGDFDGNLQSDIFLVRGRLRPTEALKVGPKRVEGWISGKASGAGKGFSFSSNGGQLTITTDAANQYNLPANIKIGAAGYRVNASTFTLDANNPNTHGLNGSSSWGLYIGFNTSTQQWDFRFRSSYSRRLYIQIDAVNDVNDPVMTGLSLADLPITNKLMMNNAGGFAEQASSRGITGQQQCSSAVAGDLDNDMDEDIYMICRTGVSNIANILYENKGDGTFRKIANAGGAAGPIGSGILDPAGTAESVILADYDLDGFLDMFITNGMLMQPLRAGGDDKLYRNLGNTNKWVQIDLIGYASTQQYSGDNKDAIGAKVYVTAAGKTQVREQGHGYHRWSQNHKRIHFGLANNSQFNVEVRWQNGGIDTFNNISADEIYEIRQGSTSGSGSINVASAITTNFPAAPQAGDECGQPYFNANYDKALYVWKNCLTNQWEIKAIAGGSATNLTFEGSVYAAGGLTNVTPVSLQGNDKLDIVSPSLVEFEFKVLKASQNGFRFNAPGGSTTQACLQMTKLPAGTPVLMGSGTKYLGTSADLGTFEICTGPPPAADECGEPSYNRATESGVFLWKDCGVTGSESWHIRVTGGGNVPALRYDGVFASDQTFSSVTPFSIEGNDTLDNSSDPSKISYIMRAAGGGQDGFDFTFSNTANVCFDPSVMPAGASVELGSGRIAVSTPLDLKTLGSCTPPSEPLECGKPSYTAGAEKQVYIWKDCAGSGDWHMRTTGGGDPDKQTYIGSISSNLGFSTVTPFSIEANDILDNSNPNLIDYTMGMRNSGQDGVDFDFPAGANTCFNATTQPAGAQVLLGETKAPMSTPFDLVTQGGCL